MHNSQFVQEPLQQHYGAPPTSQQNGQHNPSSNNLSFYNHTEGQLNDQFSQLGLNNGSPLPPVQNINLASNNVNNFLSGPQDSTPAYPPANLIAEQRGPPKEFSSSVPYNSPNQNVLHSNIFQEKPNSVLPALPGKIIQSNVHDGINNQESREFINGTPGLSNEAVSTKSNEFNTTNHSILNHYGSGLNSQQTQSAFSVVSPQSRSQRAYSSNIGAPHVQPPQLVSNFPTQPQQDSPVQKLEHQPQPSSFQPQQSKITPQQPGFPSPPNVISQSGFPTQPNLSSPQPGFPPQPNLTSQQSSFPPRPNSRQQQQQPGFPPTSNTTQQQQPSFPPTSNTTQQQQPGFPPQPNSTQQQQPGFPPQPNSTQQQQSGFPPQPNSTQQQQPGFPPQLNSIQQQQPGFPPQPNAKQQQQPGFPPQPNATPQQQPGFPPQPNATPQQQPGFPPQPNATPQQQPGFPPKSNSTQQHLGFPPRPNSTQQQQPGFPPQPNATPQQQPGFPPLPNATQQQQPGFPPQSNLTQQNLGFPPRPNSTQSQQPGFPPQPNSTQQPQPSIPSQPNSTQQHLGFPPRPNSTQQQTSFPSQRNSTPQQPGFPPQSNPIQQQSSFTPQSNLTSQNPGLPPQRNLTTQQPGFLSQPNSTQQQSGLPPQSNLTPQLPGFPPQRNATQQQPGFSPQPNSTQQQQSGFPPQPKSTPQQPGFPPQPNSSLQQPGFPPQPNSALQQPGFPPQPNSASQQPGFPPQPNSALQQPGFPAQSNLSQKLPGFPPQPNLMQQNSTLQHPGFPPQTNLPSQSGLSHKQLKRPGYPLQASYLTYQPSGFSQPLGLSSQQQGLSSNQPGLPPQQPGLPPQPQGFQSQPGNLSSQQPGFPLQSGNLPPQQAGFPPQTGFSHQQMNGYLPQQPGYPPQQSGYATQQPGFNQGTPAYMGQPAPSRRLDPEQMPSPVQVIQDDQQLKGGIFVTNQRGLVPPLVTTDFSVQDGGNASPRLIRSTMYCVPTTTDIMKQTSVPFGLVISPLAKIKPDEYPPPIINSGELGPVRCKRCKAYMSPFMQFIDGGKHFVCLLCKASTEVPVEYFQHLDHTGHRLDRSERPELCFGSYEFIVPKEYCRKETQPKPPAYVFVIDVSYNNIKSGLVRLVCAFMKELLTQLPTEFGEKKSKIRVGFITYDTTVHFYNIKETLAVPQMMVVGDTGEMFMPLLDGFLCDPEQSSHVIDALMEQIPTQFNDTRTTETILLPAIKAGMEALKNADCCGKLFVFHSSLPIAEAPGKLKNREDRKLLGTDKEKSILNPQINLYRELGEECVQVGCSVDLFITNNSYIDLATIGQVSKISGGEIFKYTYFQAEIDGQRFLSDLKHDISRPTVFDAVMRVRTSTGTRPTDFYGHFFMSNSTDVELAAIDCDKAIAIEVKHDDKLDEQDGVIVQTAILYTSCSGQRRVRIINLSLRTSGQMGELYRSCDLDTIMNFFGKQVMYKILESSGKQVKEAITNKTAQILATYRKHCASPSSAGQLILPECMKLMPLYVNCLLKCDAMSGGPDMTVDDRWYNMHLVITADIPTTLGYFYPRLIPIHTLADETSLDDVPIPDQLRCSIEKFSENGAFVLENGVYMFLWLGSSLNQTFLTDVLGIQNIAQVEIERFAVPVIDNPLNRAVRQVLSKIQEQRSHTMRLTIIRQRDKVETVMRQFLVEDHGVDNSPSYVEFLCHMHKEIRNLLS